MGRPALPPDLAIADFRAAKPRCRLTLSANAVLGTGTHDVPFDTITRQEGTFTFPTANPGEIGILRPGSYLVAVGVRRSAGGGNYSSTVFINGVASTALWLFPVTNLTLSHQFSGACVEHLEVGDVLKVRATLSGAGSSFSAGGTFMDLVRIGPDRWT